MPPGWIPRIYCKPTCKSLAWGGGFFILNNEATLGALFVASGKDITLLHPPAVAARSNSPLIKISQVQNLPLEDAKRSLPVHIRGVATSVGRKIDQWMSVQDETRGIFISLSAVSNKIDLPVSGDFY